MADGESQEPAKPGSNRIRIEDIIKTAEGKPPVSREEAREQLDRVIKSAKDVARVAKPVKPAAFEMPSVDRLESFRSGMADIRDHMAELGEESAAENERRREREDLQIDATIEIAATLRQQASDTAQLVRSSWYSGAVMQWTLYTTLLAAFLTFSLGVWGPDGLSVWFWVVAGVLFCGAAIALALWHLRSRPPKVPGKDSR